MLAVVCTLLRHLGRAVNDETGGEKDSRYDLVKQKCSELQESVMNVLPLTAIKIVVVVWQITSQVRLGAVNTPWAQYEYFLPLHRRRPIFLTS